MIHCAENEMSKEATADYRRMSFETSTIMLDYLLG